MKPLLQARILGREFRRRVGSHRDGLHERILGFLWEEFGLEAVPVPAEIINGSRAELRPADGCIWYDRELDHSVAEKLLVLAHELGHMVLHPRLRRTEGPLDFIAASAYLEHGAGGVARYSRKAREEAEANAFALEFVCPSGELWDAWRRGSSARKLADTLNLPLPLIRIQLAEALIGSDSVAEVARSRREPKLNPRQLEAAQLTGVPALINAGPGTGKTATLVHRIEYLLGKRSAEPEGLLILTYSNDAAEEIRDRIAGKFGGEVAALLQVSTFHGFGVEILRTHGHLLDVPSDASIIDEIRQREIITNLLGSLAGSSILNLRDPAETVDRALRHINHLKDRDKTPDDLQVVADAFAEGDSPAEEVRAAREFLDLYRRYEAAKADAGVIDFGDLIMGPIRIFRCSPEIVQAYRERYRWILVDEYQDVGRSVAELLKQIAGPENPPWVVGDIRQAIYRFRGAAPENVTRFAEDFPGARIIDLDGNYRSCDEVVDASNQLAALMADPEYQGPEYPVLWNAESDECAVSDMPILIAQAVSDSSEHRGIVDQVRAWERVGIPLHEIAILARRNVDVRNITLALGAAGIQATASAVVTAEGAAGDLAAILTLPEARIPSLPRATMAVARGRASADVINEAIRLAYTADPKISTDPQPKEQVQTLASEALELADAAEAGRFAEDAFEAICAFLFDRTTYLRRLLDETSGAERELGLGEIRATLAMAANFRFTHPATPPQRSRLVFAEHLRFIVCAGTPSLVPARPIEGAVQVMTCHASKGLEFPCVIVAAQTLARAQDGFAWLPPALRPNHVDNEEQADALLFVGVTRAKRALVVSYALSRSGGRNTRKITPLLARWSTTFPIATTTWDYGVADKEEVTIGPIWGGELPGIIPARRLHGKNCGIRTYLELAMNIAFPVLLQPLYPIFIGRLRNGLRMLVKRMHERAGHVDDTSIAEILEKVWPSEDFVEHPHYGLYRPPVQRALRDFACVYEPMMNVTLLGFELELDEFGTLPVLRLDLVAYYRSSDGKVTGIVIHFASIANSLDRKGRGVLWSKLSEERKIPLVLLRRMHDSKFLPKIYSLADRAIYDFLWNERTPQAMDRVAEVALERAQGLATHRFSATIDDYWCDRCPSRIACPHWMSLIP